MRTVALYEDRAPILTNAPEGKQLCIDCGWTSEREFASAGAGRCFPCTRERHKATSTQYRTCKYCGNRRKRESFVKTKCATCAASGRRTTQKSEALVLKILHERRKDYRHIRERRFKGENKHVHIARLIALHRQHDMHCPSCDSDDTRQHGQINGKQRYFCKRCCRTFISYAERAFPQEK